MAVVAIIAVLAAIAFPSYQNAVRTARRGDAKAELMRLATAQDKWRVMHPTYASLTELGGSTPSSYYAFAVDTNTDTEYAITATPQSAGGQDADICGTLTISESPTSTTATITASGCSDP